MTEYMAQQQSLNIAPSSRQDVISALLEGYGSSFASPPYTSSPVTAFKELPPPPPSPPVTERGRKSSNDKPLPEVKRMNWRFQLRVDEPASPNSPHSPRTPTRIVSKRLNRSSKPPSLTLTASNGSTAEPFSPSMYSSRSTGRPQTGKSFDEEKSLPPPPPEKSERRPQQSAMGNSSSRGRSPRKDSIHSEDGKSEATEPVKRKPLPPKFAPLASLGNGPKSGKGGPMPQPRPRKQSVEDIPQQDDRVRSAVREDFGANTSPETPRRSGETLRPKEPTAPIDVSRTVNPPPPTPKDDPVEAPQPSAKKPFGVVGLPSNPKHKKGKSSTGFDMLKNASSPRLQPQPAPNTITPGPTPSPNRMEQMKEEIVEPVREVPGADPAALSVSNRPNNEHRPFSFENIPSPPLQKPRNNNQVSPSNLAAAAPSTSAVSPADVQPAFPPRTTSRAPPPSAFSSLPSQQRPAMSEDSDSSAAESPTTPPFVPLTQAPTPSTGAPITQKHHQCYSRHATFVWSRNDFQPMACMICAKNDHERKWACVWCYLRICVECSVELGRTPGRKLQPVLEKRGVDVRSLYDGSEYVDADGGPGAKGGEEQVKGVNGKRHDSGNPTLVVWDADAEDVGDGMDFS